MKTAFRVGMAVILVLGPVHAVRASIVSLSGDMRETSAPPSLFPDVLESSSELFIITEQQHVTLSSSLNVDIAEVGEYDRFSARQLAGAGGVIPGGVMVNSYLLHFDPVDRRGGGRVEVSGEIRFDGNILGVMVGRDGLAATDPLLGLGSVGYGNARNRGLESNGRDVLAIGSDLRTLTIRSLREGDGMDEIRVVTQAFVIPEPPSMMLALCGALALGLSRQTRIRRPGTVGRPLQQ